MKAYNGLVKDNKVYFEGDDEIKDGTKVLILVKSSTEDENKITKRQLEILDKGYRMGKITYSSREEHHEK